MLISISVFHFAVKCIQLVLLRFNDNGLQNITLFYQMALQILWHNQWIKSENIILVSSVNKVGLDILFIMYGKSLLYDRKNSGPSVAPCGTP